MKTGLSGISTFKTSQDEYPAENLLVFYSSSATKESNNSFWNWSTKVSLKFIFYLI